jgi:hypothetical protein
MLHLQLTFQLGLAALGCRPKAGPYETKPPLGKHAAAAAATAAAAAAVVVAAAVAAAYVWLSALLLLVAC